MPQIFPPPATTLARLGLLALVLVPTAALTAVAVVQRSSYATGVGRAHAQPVPFSHKHHVGDDGFDCRYCHTSVERSASAGFPSTDVCMNCHRQIWNESPMLAPVRDSYRTGRPIVWSRVHTLPDFVYFSHAIHVAKGVGCTTCHGPVDRMPLTWRANTLEMGWCLSCHRRPERYVRPRDAVFRTDWQPPADQLALGRRLVKEYGIRPRTDCTTCHR